MIKREEIDYDPGIGKFVTFISTRLCDGNPMMLKATAELYCEILDGIGKLVEAKIAEFAIRYGEEVIKFAHNNIGEELKDTEIPIEVSAAKFVDSREVGRKLLEKAFPTDKN